MAFEDYFSTPGSTDSTEPTSGGSSAFDKYFSSTPMPKEKPAPMPDPLTPSPQVETETDALAETMQPKFGKKLFQGLLAGGRDILSSVGTGINTYNKLFYDKVMGGKTLLGGSYDDQYERTKSYLDEYAIRTEERLKEKLGQEAADSFVVQASRGLGQGVGQVAAFAVNPVVGITTIAAQTIGAGKQAYDSAYTGALANGKSEKEARKIANINGIITGTVNGLEIIPVGRAFGIASDILNKPLKTGLKDMGIRITKTALTESVTEGAQTLGEDVTAKYTYDPDRPAVKDAIMATLISLPTGVLFGGVGEVNVRQRNKELVRAKEDISKILKDNGAPEEAANTTADAIVAQAAVMGNEDFFDLPPVENMQETETASRQEPVLDRGALETIASDVSTMRATEEAGKATEGIQKEIAIIDTFERGTSDLDLSQENVEMVPEAKEINGKFVPKIQVSQDGNPVKTIDFGVQYDTADEAKAAVAHLTEKEADFDKLVFKKKADLVDKLANIKNNKETYDTTKQYREGDRTAEGRDRREGEGSEPGRRYDKMEGRTTKGGKVVDWRDRINARFNREDVPVERRRAVESQAKKIVVENNTIDITEDTPEILRVFGYPEAVTKRIVTYFKKGAVKRIRITRKIEGTSYYAAYKDNTLFLNPEETGSAMYQDGSIIDHEIAGHSWYLKLNKESRQKFYQALKDDKETILAAWKATGSSHTYYWNETIDQVNKAFGLKYGESPLVEGLSLEEFVDQSLSLDKTIADLNEKRVAEGKEEVAFDAALSYAVMEHNAIIAEAAEQITSKNDTIQTYIENINDGTLEFGKRGSVQFETLKTKEIPVYEGSKDLTLKTLEKLKGRATVSKQFISDLTNSGDLKQNERDIIREALVEYGDTVPVQEFVDRVEATLLPLTVKQSDAYEPTGTSYQDPDAMVSEGDFSPKYENVALSEDMRGDVATYKENIYESPVKTSAGDVHFNYQTKNYFGHTRVEDMADGETRRVIEVQSDLYQKGRIEEEGKIDFYKNFEEGNINPDIITIKEKEELIKLDKLVHLEGKRNLPKETIDRWNELSKKAFNKAKKNRKLEIKKIEQYTNPTAHFRMVREEIKKAAQDGKSVIQFPTGDTAMQIEGLGSQENNWVIGEQGDQESLSIDDISIGEIVTDERTGIEFVITSDLGNGKFKAVPARQLEFENEEDVYKRAMDSGYINKEDGEWDMAKVLKDKNILRLMDESYLAESFDISGEVDTNNPIYRFYEKDLGRYLKNNYGAEQVYDDQGVPWYQVKIDESMAEAPIMAFRAKEDISLDQMTEEYDRIFEADAMKLEQLVANREILQEYAKDHPGKKIVKYMSRKEGELTDQDVIRNTQAIEDILEFEGNKFNKHFRLADNAKEAVDDYLLIREQINELNPRITQIRKELAVKGRVERKATRAIADKGEDTALIEYQPVELTDKVSRAIYGKGAFETKEEIMRRHELAKLRENITVRLLKRTALDAIRQNIPTKERFRYLTQLSRTNFSVNKMMALLEDVYKRKLEIDVERGERIEKARKRSTIAFLKKINDIEPVMIQDIKKQLGITESLVKQDKATLDKITAELKKRISYRIENNLVPRDNHKDLTMAEREKIAEEALKLKKKGTSVVKRVRNYVKSQLKTVFSRIEEISPEMAEGLKTIEQNTAQYMNEKLKPVLDDLRDATKKMSEIDARVFQDSLYSRDMENARAIMKKYDIDESVLTKTRGVLDDLYNKLKLAGLDVNYLKDHFPRSIKPEYMEDIETRYQENLRKSQDEMRARYGRDLTEEEKQNIFAKYFRGFDAGNKILLSDGRFVEGRIIDTIDNPETSAMYEDLDVSLEQYVDQALQLYESRKFFNKLDPDMVEQIRAGEYTNVIGEFLRRKAEEGVIRADQVETLRDALQDYFGVTKTAAWQRFLMNAAYAMGLNRLSSFVPQFFETAIYLATNDPRASVAALQMGIKPSDIGIELLTDKGDIKLSKIVDYLTVPMKIGDKISATLGLNILYQRLKLQAEKDSPMLRRKIEYVYGKENVDRIMELFKKSGNVGKDLPQEVKRILYSEIGQFRVLSKGDKSKLFIKHPFWGVFRNYTVKMLNAIHDLGNDEIKLGKETKNRALVRQGITRKAMFIFALLAAGAGQQAVKDWLKGKEEESLGDYALNAFLNIFGLSRYNVDQVGKNDLMGALVDVAAPAPIAIPVSIAQTLVNDIKKDFSSDPEKMGAEDYKILRQTPLIGDIITNLQTRGDQAGKKAVQDAMEMKDLTPAQAAKKAAEVKYGKDATKTQVSNLTKDIAFQREFGTDNKWANAVDKATSNKEKVEVLKKAREKMGVEEFRKFFDRGRKRVTLPSGNQSPILISDDLKTLYLQSQ